MVKVRDIRPSVGAQAPRPQIDRAAETAAPPVAAEQAAGETEAGGPIRPIPPQARSRPGEFMLMQYNVENLFDISDDPETADEDFTPEGRARWGEEKLQAKLQNLGRVVRHVNGGRGPDILALQEVENAEVVDRMRRGALRDMGYREPVLIEGEDHRGIDVALLTRYPLAGEAKIHDVSDDSWRGNSRPILEVPLDVEGREVTVFVNHWPSKRGGAQAEAERSEAAQRLRGLVADKLRRDPGAEVVMVGDFNTDLGEAPLQELGASADQTAARASNAEAPAFFNAMHDAAQHKPRAHPREGAAPAAPESHRAGDLADEISARRASLATAHPAARSGDPDAPGRTGTHYWRKGKQWSTLDHVVMSKGLLDAEGVSYVPGSAQVVHPDFMENRDGSPKRFMPPQRRTRPGEKEPDLPPREALGYSDHFPVVARFRRLYEVD